MNIFSNWDAQHYLYISQYGYTHDKLHAFLPLYPYILSILRKLLPYNIILTSYIFNSICHFISIYILYKLTLYKFKSHSYAKLSCLY